LNNNLNNNILYNYGSKIAIKKGYKNIVYHSPNLVLDDYRYKLLNRYYEYPLFLSHMKSFNNYDSYDYNNNYDRIETQTGFALGISVGGKFVLAEGFTAEVLLGIGRNLIKEESDDNDYYFQNEVVARFGISLGYRF
jgi:hypothetical protein